MYILILQSEIFVVIIIVVVTHQLQSKNAVFHDQNIQNIMF